jgi:hypothetical protein
LENPRGSLLWHSPRIDGLRAEAAMVVTDIFCVQFDACAHGASLPGEGEIKKLTALLTNCCLLLPLSHRCACQCKRIKLEGTFRVNGKWVSRNAYAGAYAPLLVRRWARLLEPLRGSTGSLCCCGGGAFSLPSKRPLHWRCRMWLLACGDVHPHPGPRVWAPRSVDLFVADVSAFTASRYDKALLDFEIFLHTEPWFTHVFGGS